MSKLRNGELHGSLQHQNVLTHKLGTMVGTICSDVCMHFATYSTCYPATLACLTRKVGVAELQRSVNEIQLDIATYHKASDATKYSGNV